MPNKDPPPAIFSRKYIFHNNTLPYKLSNWIDDITTAMFNTIPSSSGLSCLEPNFLVARSAILDDRGWLTVETFAMEADQLLVPDTKVVPLSLLLSPPVLA